MCHVSRLMCHISFVSCHMSGVTWHLSAVKFFFFFYNVLELIGGASVINGAYSIMFYVCVLSIKHILRPLIGQYDQFPGLSFQPPPSYMFPVAKNNTFDTWHVTCNTWHMTRDRWQVGGGEPSLKILAPQLLRLGSYRWNVTPDTSHLTPDMWHMTYAGGSHHVKILSPLL